MIAAVVLAAGAATRFGSPKQLVLVPHVVAALRGAPDLAEIVVVTGAHPFDVAGARVTHAADWGRGPGASLRAGLRSLGPEIDAAVVVLGDGPDLRPEAVARVVAAWHGGRDAVVAASYGGERGHPVLLARSAWGDVPDEGARGLPARLVPCDDLGSPGDVDTPADLPDLPSR
jgi:CTP:molybdopterin cytidylyltransferase MocA